MDAASSIKFNITGATTADQMTETGTGAHTLAGSLSLAFSQTFDQASWQIMNLASGPADGFSTITLTGAYAGTLTEVSPGYWNGAGGNGQNLSFSEATGIVSVPEPASLSLIALAGAGLLGRRRRKA
jgi:hypothetical protein